MIEQQRQQFPLPGPAFRQRRQNGAALLVEELPAHGELGGKALVDLDPFLEVERLDPHGEAPGAVEKGAIADHGSRLSHPSRGVKRGFGSGRHRVINSGVDRVCRRTLTELMLAAVNVQPG